MIQKRYGHLARVRERSSVVEFRVEKAGAEVMEGVREQVAVLLREQEEVPR